MIIVRAPSDAAANAGETALASGSVFGAAATLAHRQGRYLVVRCADAAGVVTLLAECAARGWDVIGYGARVIGVAEAMQDGVLYAWVSGYLAGLEA